MRLPLVFDRPNPATTSLFFGLLLAVSAIPAYPAQSAIKAPEPGVLCDSFICASDKGISCELTEKYLGKKAATKLLSQGDFDLTEFTFVSGLFCDVKERLCRKDRYYGVNGQRSGAVSNKYTKLLFGE